MQSALGGLRNQMESEMIARLITETNALMNLSLAAYEADDLAQVALCDLALFGHVRPATMDEVRSAGRANLATHYGVARDGTTQDVGAQARAERECLRTIEYSRNAASYGTDDHGAY